MLDTLFESVGLRCTLHERSHDVPSHPTIGNMIERGELSRKRVRVFVRGGRSNAKGNIFRGVSHGRDEQTDVENRYLGSGLQGWVAIFVYVIEAQDVCKEDAMEAVVVEVFGQANPVIKRGLFL
jgi:hypothetical protein